MRETVSEGQVGLLIYLFGVIAFLAMCYAGYLRGKDRRLPASISHKRWAYLFAAVATVPVMLTSVVAMNKGSGSALAWMFLIPLWAMWFLFAALIQYWGARVIGRGIVAGRNLFAGSSERYESK